MTSKQKVRTTLRINKIIYEEIKKEANKLGISVNAYIIIVLLKEMARQIKEERSNVYGKKE